MQFALTMFAKCSTMRVWPVTVSNSLLRQCSFPRRRTDLFRKLAGILIKFMKYTRPNHTIP